jgi:hypothetical protein
MEPEAPKRQIDLIHVLSGVLPLVVLFPLGFISLYSGFWKEGVDVAQRRFLGICGVFFISFGICFPLAWWVRRRVDTDHAGNAGARDRPLPWNGVAGKRSILQRIAKR